LFFTVARTNARSIRTVPDENPDSVNDAAFAVTMGPSPTRYVTKWQDVPAVYHGGGCGFSFADGHAEIKKWKDGRTLSLKSTYTRSVTSVTQSNPDNPDILWVMERTTALK
jgi:prepilin-type processing-associated H-X9-DG protein